MAIKDLTTEQRNPASMHIDTVSTAEMVKIMNEEDKKVNLLAERITEYFI